LLPGADRGAELIPVHPAGLGDLVPVGRGCRVGVDGVHRADLVLQHAVSHPGLVAEPGQDQHEFRRADPEFLPQPAAHAVGDRLAGQRMPAAGVGPDARPGELGLGPPGQQELAGLVEQVRGEGQMQRGLAVMDDRLGRGAAGGPGLVEQDNVFHVLPARWPKWTEVNTTCCTPQQAPGTGTRLR
jgi:hypothetical protein